MDIDKDILSDEIMDKLMEKFSSIGKTAVGYLEPFDFYTIDVEKDGYSYLQSIKLDGTAEDEKHIQRVYDDAVKYFEDVSKVGD